MKIGFDARMITHPGIGRYIRCLLPEMVKQAPKDRFVVFGEPEKLKDISDAPNVKIARWNVPIYSVWEQSFPFRFPMDMDLLHVPHFNIPVFFGRKMVVTVHDLIYLLFPDAVPTLLAKHYARFMIESVLKKASRVVTVSNHTKNDLVRLFGEQYSRKMDVIYEAPGKEFRRIKDKARIADVRTRHRLDENIILYVGSVKPHKNIKTLIKMFARLKSWGVPHQLVICGRWDKKEDHLKEEMSDRYIRYLGEVTSEDLVALYSMSDVLVHLSLYEGFGLTVLEAMQCGTPVVVSNASSLPEVAGTSAFVVPPQNLEQIADTVYNVIINQQLKDGMMETGLDHAKKFSWEETAQKTLEVYRKA